MRLDAQNLDILQMLLSEGRISKKELAERVTVLPIPCWEHLKKFEKADVIAYLHSHDPKPIYRVSRALQYDMDAANRTQVTGAPIPFGSAKRAGLGRQGAPLAMKEFTEIKYVCRDRA